MRVAEKLPWLADGDYFSDGCVALVEIDDLVRTLADYPLYGDTTAT